MSTFSWTCPYCSQTATINPEHDMNFFEGIKYTESKEGRKKISGYFLVCTNLKCKRFILKVFLYKGKKIENSPNYNYSVVDKQWQLIPQSNAKVFPEYIPAPIKDDYEEACSILDLSPKASATLARRCLQGMIRDFYKVKMPIGHKGLWSLKDEIKAIEDKVDSDVWDAIEAVRKVGNIGAHMEQDINLIIDVEPGEAEKLIGLIEMLVEEWYINAHKRQVRLAEVQEIAQKKDLEKTKKVSS